MEEHVSNSRRWKPTENIWFNDWRFYLLCHPWKLKKTLKNKKAKKRLKKDASPQIPSLSSVPVSCFGISTSCSLILQLLPHPYFTQLYMCVFFLLFTIFPISQPSHQNPGMSHFAVQRGLSPLRILRGGICLFKSCSGSNKETTQPFDLSSAILNNKNIHGLSALRQDFMRSINKCLWTVRCIMKSLKA